MDYPKLISEKWNLTAKFNCLQAIYFLCPKCTSCPYVWARGAAPGENSFHRLTVTDLSIRNLPNWHVSALQVVQVGKWRYLKHPISILLQIKSRNEGSHLQASVNKWSIVDIVFAIAIAIAISHAVSDKFLHSNWPIRLQRFSYPFYNTFYTSVLQLRVYSPAVLHRLAQFTEPWHYPAIWLVRSNVHCSQCREKQCVCRAHYNLTMCFSLHFNVHVHTRMSMSA